MLTPISWLKDYVEIKLPLKDLMWKLTEVGLTCEAYKKIGDEIILDIEVTPNRPDCMSIMGIAREIAAIQNSKVKEPKIKALPKATKNLPIKVKNDFDLIERWSAVIISEVSIKSSPKWLQERIRLMGHSPINNVIDITNYVMYELGIPMHAFDYDEIKGGEMIIEKSKGGEEFTSVDGITYILPKDAMIIKDSKRVIDLIGIKGGLNSGIKGTTKNILLHVAIDNPVLIRRASRALALRSDASAIYERGTNKGGTLDSLIRAANLILDNAGGKLASNVTDLKKSRFEPWKLNLSFENLEKKLGIKIDSKEVIKILGKLNLSPKKAKDGVVCTIPTYRGDLKIEEDLIEEIARFYGYNRFPKTLPEGRVNTGEIPYYFDDSFHLKLKEILTSSGYSEVKTLSLISTELIENCNLNPKSHITLTNPVSIDYEHMRINLIPSLLTGLKINPEENVSIFELDKTYPEELYKLSGISKNQTFRKFKGVIDLILERLNIADFTIELESSNGFWHPNKSATIKIGKEVIGEFGEISPQVLNNLGLKYLVYAFELDVKSLEKYSKEVIFKPVPEFPPQIEDITLIFPPKTRVGDVVKTISTIGTEISKVDLTDTYKDSYTFRLWYQHPTKTLTNEDVERIRKKVITSIKSKFGGTLRN